MIPYKYRFHGHASLRYVYKNGETRRAQYFHLRYVKNSRRQNPRIAVVVSKKVYKSAVGRNRIRRRMYELFRHQLPYVSGGIDIVCIITHPGVRNMSIDELRATFESTLLEAGICNNDLKNDTIEHKGIIR